jgi:4-coumarate--CoA ligase
MFYPSLGMTETTAAVVMWPITQKRGTSGSSSPNTLIYSNAQEICYDIGAGHLIPGCMAKIVRPDGSLAGFNEPGELVVKTPSIALGYANDAEA